MDAEVTIKCEIRVVEVLCLPSNPSQKTGVLHHELERITRILPYWGAFSLMIFEYLTTDIPEIQLKNEEKKTDTQ